MVFVFYLITSLSDHILHKKFEYNARIRKHFRKVRRFISLSMSHYTVAMHLSLLAKLNFITNARLTISYFFSTKDLSEFVLLTFYVIFASLSPNIT